MKRISCDDKIFWKMPVIGLGTFRMNGMECKQAVQHALKFGYCHIDTAECYNNYNDISNAIKSTKQIDRKNIFITSKLSPRSMRTENKVESAITNCLKSLDTDYIDLFLIHWPGVSKKKIDDPTLKDYRLMSWKVMEKYVNQGIIRSIGVSNFEIKHLKPLLEEYKKGNLQFKPSINQIEFHPYYQRYDLIEYCQKNDIQITAYGSLGAAESHSQENMKNNKHPLLDHSVILELSLKYKKTPAQILLRYGLDHNMAVIPKSRTKHRIQENIQIFDFSIDPNDMKLIDDINKNGKAQKKFAWNPSIIH